MKNIPDRASNVVRIHPEYTVTEEPPQPLAQFNLFTGEAEPVPIEVGGPTEEGGVVAAPFPMKRELKGVRSGNSSGSARSSERARIETSARAPT